MNLYFAAYKSINLSFKDKYIFQIGTGRGFCAEMIHLLKIIQACLYNKIQLCLGQVNRPKGYAVCHGWEDYFKPIFPVEKGIYLDALNRSLFPFQSIPLLKSCSRLFLRQTCGKHNYMFDPIENEFPKKSISDIFAIEGDYWTLLRALIESLWRYRNDVLYKINAHKNKLEFDSNKPYLGVHIRRGDKILEAPYVELEKYAEIIQTTSLSNMPIYLATDDIRVLDGLRNILGSDFEIHSLSNFSMIGYDQNTFNYKSLQERWKDTVFLLFELEMLSNSTVFVGAEPSNVYYWIRYRKANKNMYNAGDI